MKKHLLTRILSITLAFTILSSDISAYAASDTLQTETEVQEQLQGEVLPEESETTEEASEEEVFEEEENTSETEESQSEEIQETIPPVEEEPVPEPETVIEVDMEDVYYLVPKTETAATAIGMYGLTDGQVSLRDGNEENWIDRLDLTNATEIRALYDTLVEASDNDGENDFLIDDAYLSADYNLTIAEIKQTIEVNISNAADEAAVKTDIEKAVGESAGNVAAGYDPYIIAARDAFDRDHPEVFWLSGESVFGYSVSCEPVELSAEATKVNVEYTVNLFMALTGTIDGEAFDIRAAEYQKQETIKTAISNIESACNNILTETSELNNYEKIKYFNDILTKSNEYNTSADLNAIDHDCRECVSALEGCTGTEGPVCEGYARALKVLCDKAGIPCVLVSGTAYNSTDSTGEAHMWNYVQLDGSWYAVDVTWNDPVGGNSGAVSDYESEEWLLLGSDTVVDGMTFAESHLAENVVSANGVAFTNGPQISKDKFVYSEEPDDGETEDTENGETENPEEVTKYQIVFETNGGVINSEYATEYDGNTVVQLPTDVTKDGHIFAGWYETETFEGESITEISIGSTQDKVFYAKWEAEIKEEEKIHAGYFVNDGEKYYADSNGVLQSGWIKIGTDWHYFDKESGCKELEYETDGYLYILENGNICYFTNKTTLLKNSWQNHAGFRYYFDENGFAKQGWFEDGKYEYYAETAATAADKSPVGNVVKGVKAIDGKIYGFHSTSYYRLTGWQTIGTDRYFFEEQGEAVIGWYQEGDYWYYAKEDGKIVKGEQEIADKTYYFDNNYRLTTGWVKLNNVWRFFDNAENYLERYEIDYVKENGWLILQEEAARKSYVDAKNNLLKGWQTISGNRYYFDANGIVETDWFQVGNYYYYADADGIAAKGLKTINDENYCFHTSSYYRLTGWQTVSGKRFYFDSEGKAKTGLFDVSGKTYLAEKKDDSEKNIVKGQLVTGVRNTEEGIRIFHTSQYYMLTGWQTINGQKYYIKEDGTAIVNQWYQEGDYWYHADANGAMAKGLVTINEEKYYFDNNYRLSTGWKNINGKMYFFDSVAEEPWKCHALDYEETTGWLTLSDGRKSYINVKNQVLTGWQTIDGKRYYFDGSGIMETGLFQVGRYYYYAQIEKDATSDAPEGSIATGAKKIEGKTYGFHTSQYYRLTGWQTLNGQRYYFQDDCSAVTGWYQEGDYWYYADAEGRMKKGTAEIDGKTYYFDSNYRVATGWVKLDNNWRFFDNADSHLERYELSYTLENGWLTLEGETARKSYVDAKNNLLKGWQTISGNRCYFDSVGIMETGEFKVGNYYYYADEDGTVAKGIKVIDGETYCFHTSSYYRLTGWQTISGKRFFLDSEGKAATGLFETGGRKYYAETTTDAENDILRGTVVTGRKKVGDITYVFHPSQYYMLTGWQTVNGQRYFINEDGSAVVNQWYQEGDYWYHADENGYMAKGLVTIDDEEYYFDNNYRLSIGWKRIGNEMYFFDSVAEEPEKCHAVAYEGTVGGWMTLSDGRKSYINTKYQVLTGWQTINGKRYYFDGTGIMETGLFQVGRYYYYAEENETADSPEGSMAVGVKLIDGKIYGFHTSQYYRLSGWQTLNGQRYYFQDDCSAVTGWYQEGNYWYYANEAGEIKKGEVTLDVEEERRTYYFDSNYRLTTGWVKLNNVWRYFNNSENNVDCYEVTSDQAVSGWITLSNGDKSYIHTKNGILKGWQTISNQRYYFDTAGIMQNGWFEVSGYWYYANEDGSVLKGEQVIGEKTYYFDGNYRLTTGWVKLNNVWRFFDNAEDYLKRYEISYTAENGWLTIQEHPARRSYVDAKNNLLKGWQTISGNRYYFDSLGIMETAWFQVGSNWYYADVDGVVAKNAVEIDGEVYGFHATQYYRLSGWQTLNGQRYRFQDDYSAVTGWYQEGDYWYYADDNGCMAKGLTPIDGKEYYFDTNYRLSTGWKRIGDKMYFFDSVAEAPEKCHAVNYEGAVGSWFTLTDGRKSYINTKYQVLTGWQTINGKRYYFDGTGIMETGLFQVGRYYYYAEIKENESVDSPEGSMATGAKIIDGKVYGFHTSQYYRLTGWQTLNGERYYFQDDCSAVVGWYQDGNYWYYADANGCMAKGEVKIGNKTYYFDSNYRLTTGWVKLSNVWRFFDTAENYLERHELSYTEENGWITLENGKKSYVHTKNGILKGWQTISGNRYYFDTTGIMQTGEFKVGNYFYYADADGVAAKGLKVINGETYCFHASSYYRLTGWQTVSGKRLFLDSEGKATTGLFETGGRKYYAEEESNPETGVLKGTVVTGQKKIGEKVYVFHPSQYYMLTGWQTINGQRYFLNADGSAIVEQWYQEGDYWYHANENGAMSKGLVTINNKKYYFDNNYRLSTGWKRIGNEMYFFDSAAENPNGCHAVDYEGTAGGWITLADGRRSYINAKYQVLTGWQTISGQRYYFDDKGIALTGEFQVGRYHYYAETSGDSQGVVAKNAVEINEKIYGFHPSQYYRLTGWQTLNGQRYYFQNDCSAVTGWYQEGNYWYYAKADGSMLKGEQQLTENGEYYYFDGNYRLASGWIKVGSEWKFFDNAEDPEQRCRVDYMKDGSWAILEDGRRSYIHSKNGILKGWQTISGQRYYFDTAGIMQTGWFEVGGYWYYATDEGIVLKGLQTEILHVASGEKKTYYFDNNYRLKTGWQTISGVRYHFAGSENPAECYAVYSGSVSKGWFVFERKKSYFNDSLNPVTGWQTIENKKYYFDANGVMQTGWFQVGTYWYYAHATGVVASGTLNLKIGEETKTYYFDDNLRLQLGWKTINGKKYYIEISETPENYKITCVGIVGAGWHTMEDGNVFYTDSAGNVKTGWQTIDKQRYYFDASGMLETGWFTVSGKTYYADEDGIVAKGVKTIGEDTYVFHSSQYYMLTGFQSYGGNRYYLQPDGKAKTGWFAVGTDRYYGGEAGVLAAGAKEIGRETYFFHTSSNYRLTGWQSAGGKRYYLDTDGTARTGWFTIGGKIYYGEPTATGELLKGTLGAGAKEINGKTYFFHTSSNYRMTGWQTANGQRYYLDIDGTAKTGWFEVGGYYYYGDTKEATKGIVLKGLQEIGENKLYYFDSNYRLKTGWQTIDHKKYFFENAKNPEDCYKTVEGNVKIGWQTIEGKRYYYDEKGVLQTGWFSVSNKQYYADSDGVVAKGNKTIDGKTYCFHTGGYYMLTGWQTINGQRYYLEADGSAKTGWFEVGGKTYYADSDGVVAKGAVTVGENTYVFHSSQYYMLTGFQSYNGRRYYLQKDGAAKTGWFTVGSDLYYSNPTEQDGALKGTLASGAKEIGGETYFFHTSSNYRLTGWQTVNGQRYYLGADGKATTGWFTVSGKIYYGEPATTDAVLKGTVAKGVKVIQGKTYCFHTSSYYRLTGWQTIKKQRFYLQSDGSAITGWFTVGGKTYYAEPKVKDGEIQEIPVGIVAAGAKTIDGKNYVFHTSQYYRLTGWQTVSGQRFYLDADGVAKTGWFEVGGKTYYADADGIVAKGAVTIGENTYVFHSSQYYMLTGFQSYNGKRYYLQKDGTAKTGWFTVGSDLYYGNPTEQDGVLKGTLASGAKEIGGETYFFHTSSNYRLTGWQTVSGQRYYLETDGIAKTGWFTISGKIYYAEPDSTDSALKGTVAKGVKEIAGKTYCFHTSNYYRLTGWQTVSGQRYYLDKNGVAKTGWFTISGYHYYANPDGIIAKGLAEIPYGTEGQKKTYYFDSNYRLKTGWQTINGKKYFFENAVIPEECYATVATYDIRTGWFELENGQVCYADSKGNIKTGWQTIDKQRYYFDANGVLQTGWFSVSNKQYYADSDGAVAKGVKIINNKTYAFHSSQYYMLTGWQTVNSQRYYFDTDGSAKTDWFTISGKSYYAGTDGVVSKGAVTIGKDTYVFHRSQYYMLTGFQSYSGKRYYLQKNGTAKTGWFSVGSDLYYGNPTEQDGVLKGTLASGAKEIDGETYFFHTSSNYRVTGWQTVSGQRYYLDTDGTARNGWFTISGKIYYAEPLTTDAALKGTLAKGVKEINGKTYVFHTSSYYRLTGWQTVNGQRYYLNTDGTAKKGWFTVSGKKYYSDPVVAKGLVNIDGKGYYFHTSQYYMLTGFQTISKERYYFDTEGIMETGWFENGGYAYYANEDGIMVKGFAELSYATEGVKKYYYFDSNYRQKTGWQTINGKKYFFAQATTPEECYATYEGMSGAGWIEMGNGQLCYADSKGNVKTGWQTISGNRYYFDGKGILQTDWFTVGKYRYYGEPIVKTGEEQEIPIGVVAKGAKEIGNETYVFHGSSYYMLTGWQTVNGQRFYLDTDGSARTGWFTISGKTYYGDNAPQTDDIFKGSLVKGAKEIDGETYVFHSTDYSRLTGWQTVGDKKYYIQANGTAKTGWFNQNGYWYYGTEESEENKPKGTMERSMRTIGEHTYYFDTNYRLSTGWKVVNGIKYFFNIDGNPRNCYLIYSGLVNSGWFELEDGRKSYIDTKGNAVTGWQTIEGKKYYFDASGIMQRGWLTISGVEYFFNADGIYIPMTAPGITSLTSTSYETVDVKWNLVEGVQSYILEYSTNNVFPSWETVKIELTDTSICEYRVENLEGDTTYYFRLRYTTWSDDSENADLYYSRYSAVKSVAVRGEVAATATSATISECQIVSGSRDGGITVQLKASLKDRIKSADDKYYIVETESYGTAIDLATPVGSVDKDFEIDAEFVIDAGDGSDHVRESVDRALMNKFALAVLKEDGSYQVISTPMGITNPEEISENTDDIFRAISKKGIQGIYYASDTKFGMLNAKDQNTKQTLINMNIEDLVGTAGESGYTEYVYKGKTYYFSKCTDEIANIKSLNDGYEEYMYYYSQKANQSRKIQVCVTVNLLLGYSSADAYLIDPAARTRGYRYYTLNVREEKARETYEALFFYLGEIFGQEDCYVTNWILGNEVNSSRAWNYQGSLSQDAYMQVYAAAFRLLYNGVKAGKSGNNVFISLDNGWTAAPDTYAGKTILDKFAAYAQKENPGMKWSIAYHGYSYPLTRCDFWNDNTYTINSVSTRYISMKNINVLTDYAASLEKKYDKPEGSIRIILSEQGYNAGQGANIQAEALARGYYIAEFNDRIDAFIIRAVIDDQEEMRGGLYLGIHTWDEKKRISFYVYEFMDSNLTDFANTAPERVSTDNLSKVKTAKNILCNTDWESKVPNFSRSKLAGMY